MATENYKQDQKPSSTQENKDLLSSYLGLSFTIFLAFQSNDKALSLRLHQAECELKDLYSKRKEDSKATARVVEIFASYRHAWMQEEKRLLHQIDEDAQEIEILRAKLIEFEKSEVKFMSSVEDLKRDIYESDEMLSFMVNSSEGVDSCFVDDGVNIIDEMSCEYGKSNYFEMEHADFSSKFWAERENPWQDVQHQPLESVFRLKPFGSRRESPWKLDDELTGVSAKLKQLEHELVNFERIGNNDLLKIPSMPRKQVKRYLGLAERIDDLCQRMQTSDPYEPEISSTEFDTMAYRILGGSISPSAACIRSWTEADSTTNGD